jgi:hypothetical protein
VRDQVSHPYKTTGKITVLYILIVALGGLVISVLANRPRAMDFKGDKIRSTPSFGGEVKLSDPFRRFTACERTLEHGKMFVGKIQRPCFQPVFHLLRY